MNVFMVTSYPTRVMNTLKMWLTRYVDTNMKQFQKEKYVSIVFFILGGFLSGFICIGYLYHDLPESYIIGI